MKGVGLYVEENLQEILGRFHASVLDELGFHEPALRLAAPILLQDIARAMRRGGRVSEPWRRAMLLVVSQPEGGIRGLVREFGMLRRATWETLAQRGHAVPSDERREFDHHFDEALAFAAERWASLVRILSPEHARAALGELSVGPLAVKRPLPRPPEPEAEAEEAEPEPEPVEPPPLPRRSTAPAQPERAPQAPRRGGPPPLPRKGNAVPINGHAVPKDPFSG